MNDQSRRSDLSLMKFGVGQPVPRKEDPTLVRGEGRYTDDVNLPGQAYAVIVRSRVRAWRIRAHRRRRPRAMPGVLAVYTGADLAAAGSGRCRRCRVQEPRRHADEEAAAARRSPSDKVRYRRRAGRLRRRRDARAGAGRRRGGRASTSSRCRR